MKRDTRWTRVARAAAAAWLLFAADGCTKRQLPPESPPMPQPPSPPDGPLNGSERVGWVQQVSSGTNASDYTYVVYVDGIRRPMSNVECGPVQGSRHSACEAPLPQLTPGSHTLRFAAVRTVDGEQKESEQSEPLAVTRAAGVSAPSTPPVPVSARPQGKRIGRIEVVGEGFTAPADVVVAPDGRVFVAESGGIVLIVDAGAASVAAELTDVFGERDFGAQSITLHPQFERTRLVYVAYVSEGRDGAPVFRVSRFREAGGRLGERAVLLDEVPATAHARVAIRFGADRRLYVSIGDSDPSTASQLASLNGKVLRLDDDGRRPDDNPLPTIVYSTASHRPAALAASQNGDLWTMERTDSGGLLRRVQAASSPDGSHPGTLPIPLAFVPSAVAFSGDRGADGRVTESILVASRDAEDIFRMAVGELGNTADREAAPERLLDGRYGPISAVATAADGSIFFCTDRRQQGRIMPASDYVARIVPAPSTASHR